MWRFRTRLLNSEVAQEIISLFRKSWPNDTKLVGRWLFLSQEIEPSPIITFRNGFTFLSLEVLLAGFSLSHQIRY
jgi:hypothetical protein